MRGRGRGAKRGFVSGAYRLCPSAQSVVCSLQTRLEIKLLGSINLDR